MSMFFTYTNKKNRQVQKSERGFTLVEMLVSLALFSIVITIGIGSLLIMIDVNAKAQALYSSTTNLSYALDAMTREIRTGYHYNCQENPSEYFMQDPDETNDCDEGNYITFTREKDGAQYGYRLINDAIEQYEDADPNDGNPGNWIAITSVKDVIVDDFTLRVTGSDSHDDGRDEVQPTVDIFISGRINNGLDVDTEFSVQTHIVERRLDIY